MSVYVVGAGGKHSQIWHSDSVMNKGHSRMTGVLAPHQTFIYRRFGTDVLGAHQKFRMSPSFTESAINGLFNTKLSKSRLDI